MTTVSGPAVPWQWTMDIPPAVGRVSSKQTKKFFWFVPKQDLFRLCLVCFVKPKTKNFGFVSVFRAYIYWNNRNKQNCFEINRTVLKQIETTLNFLKNTKILKILKILKCFGWSSVCFGSIEKLKLSVSVDAKQPKQTFCFGYCRN
jgi:hypothetical protein